MWKELGLGIALLFLIAVAAVVYREVSNLHSLMPAPVSTVTPQGMATSTGMLTGTITLSPTCPVEHTPPLPGCEPRGFQTLVRVVDQNGVPVVTTSSDLQGNFSIAVPTGTYQVEAMGLNPYPRCAPQSASIAQGSTTAVAISCDTGIR